MKDIKAIFFLESEMNNKQVFASSQGLKKLLLLIKKQKVTL